jgi:ornithine cyclodeaminase/alanine dehydrogenase-like protein (mu-crystallin family)
MYITEKEVTEKLSVNECIEVLRKALALDYMNIPRYRLRSENSILHVMSASIPHLGIMGLKAYGVSRIGGNFMVLLFDEKSGSLMATVEADAMGQIRTGAASGLATDELAVREARIGAVIGTGYQAETQLLAIDAVRGFEAIRIFSRSPENRKTFIQELQPKVRAKLVEANSAQECVTDADVICTITSAKEPVLFGRWLKAGAHINAAGVNWANKREIDEEAVRKSTLIVVDNIEQSKIEAGDLIHVFNPDDWSRVVELRDVLRGKAPKRFRQDITLFKSNGIAAEDIATALHVYNKIGQSKSPGVTLV